MNLCSRYTFSCRAAGNCVVVHLMIVMICQEAPYLVFPTVTITRTPNMVPIQSARSQNPAVTHGIAFRYNIQSGAAFSISCFGGSSIPDYTLEFYKDGRVIEDGDLPNTTLTPADPQTLQKYISLNFTNFQPEHNGVYYCNATLTDGSRPFILNETADLYLYGTCKL